MSEELRALGAIGREETYPKGKKLVDQPGTERGNSDFERELTFHDSFEFGSLFLRNTVPELGSSEMNIIDRVEVGVFDVPCESSSPHSEIEVRGYYSRDRAVARS